jgi:thioredoxin 1
MKIIDFYADWCGPCKAMAPVIERLKAEGIPIEKVNVDENRDLASQYGIRSIPTLIFVNDSGDAAATLIGGQSEATILSKWQELNG